MLLDVIRVDVYRKHVVRFDRVSQMYLVCVSGVGDLKALDLKEAHALIRRVHRERKKRALAKFLGLTAKRSRRGYRPRRSFLE